MESSNKQSVDSEEVVDQEPEVEILDGEDKVEVIDQETTNEEAEDDLETNDEIDRLKAEAKDNYERMLRIQAEYDNYKRRTQNEKILERKYRSQDLANELLPALDNFERALQSSETEDAESILKGIEMVYNQITEAFKSQGIEEVDAVGEDFDPNLHHAVMQVEEEDVESNKVIEVLQKGYILNDRVLRAAMVKVNK